MWRDEVLRTGGWWLPPAMGFAKTNPLRQLFMSQEPACTSVSIAWPLSTVAVCSSAAMKLPPSSTTCAIQHPDTCPVDHQTRLPKMLTQVPEYA